MTRTLGNKFILFIAALIVAAVAAGFAVQRITDDTARDAAVKGFMLGFDLAALLFLLASAHLLRIGDPAVIRDHAAKNDANRTTLLLITLAISAAIFGAVAMETLGAGGTPGMKTKILIVGTLLTAWLFANTIYALHYAHLFYWEGGGIAFPDTKSPVYADFVYFAFTLGMTFQTSDVAIANARIRKVVTLHCLAAFVFNLGILAFTINVIGG